MANPMPVTVYGPVTPISPSVRVTGVLAGAKVEILANGQAIGQASAANPGELLVPLATQPNVGDAISATQTTSDGTSEAAKQTITVVDVRDPLPVPVIQSALNNCMADIQAGALVPGATVVTTIGGQAFGSTKPDRTSGWLGIDDSTWIAPASVVEIHQEANIGGQNRVGKPVQSLPVAEFTLHVDFLPVPSLDPLVQCDTSRNFTHVVPGAQTTITNNGAWELWGNVATAFHGSGGISLKQGTADASQAMPRCHLKGQSATLPVAAAATPPSPAVAQDLCPQTLRLRVSGLAPGGVLHVARAVVDADGHVLSNTPIGDLGIQYADQDIDLPPSVHLSDPQGKVFIFLAQSRCAGTSGNKSVQVAPVAGPFGPPKITPPLVDCARGIPITDAHPGSLVQAFDASSGTQMSDSVTVTAAAMIVFPWFPLVAGKRVLVRQRGCNADGDSAAITVEALPAKLPVPQIAQPVLPETGWVKVSNVIPGARLYLLINNQVQPDSFDAYSTTAIIMISGTVLKVGDNLIAAQKLCDQTSLIDVAGVPVTKGQLKVTVIPATAVRGRANEIMVIAADSITAMPVSGLTVQLNGQPVGITGTAFAYSPKEGDPNPSGKVLGGMIYNDASFSITLIEPVWILSLHTGPIPVFISNEAEFTITNITWQVTPEWDPNGIKKISVPDPSPGTLVKSVTLPIPPSSTKNVSVSISGTAATNGAIINGLTLSPQSVSIAQNTRIVTYKGSNETIAWVLAATAYQDANNPYKLDPVVAAVYQAIKP